MKEKKPKLTKKQQMFVKEYIKDLNATQAAIRAGYSAKTANAMASQMLAKLNIQDAVKIEMDKRSKRVEIDADWVLNKFAELHKRCTQVEPVLDKDGEPIGEYKFDGANANRALENIAKHVNVNAYASSKHEHTGKDGSPIQYVKFSPCEPD